MGLRLLCKAVHEPRAAILPSIHYFPPTPPLPTSSRSPPSDHTSYTFQMNAYTATAASTADPRRRHAKRRYVPTWPQLSRVVCPVLTQHAHSNLSDDLRPLKRAKPSL